MIANPEVKKGEMLIVCGRYRAKVEDVLYDARTDRTEIRLCYGEHGKGRTYLHDYGKIWKKLSEVN